MYINYIKMTEVDYLKLIYYQDNDKKKIDECNFIIDKSKRNIFSKQVEKKIFQDEIKKINIDFIQFKNELFDKNLLYLRSLILTLTKQKIIQDINIRIYSHDYLHYKNEIDASIYCNSNDKFCNNYYQINFKRILIEIFIKKIFGLRLSMFFYKLYSFTKLL